MNFFNVVFCVPLRPRRTLAVTIAFLGIALVGCGGGTATPPATASGGNGVTATGGSTTTGSGGTGVTAGSGGATGTGGSPVASGGSPGSTGGSASGGSGPGGIGGGVSGSGGTSDAGTQRDADMDSSGSGGAAGGGSGGNGGRAGTGGAAGVQGGGAGGAGGNSTKLKAAMVVRAAGTPTAGDNVMLGRMTARGIQTTIFSDGAVTAAAVAAMDLIVISSSAESGPLAAKLRDVAKPVLCIENGEFALMGMTPATLNTDFGMVATQTQVQITTAGNPLVGTLSGAVTISSVAGDFGWGIPGAAAVKGATLVGNANRFVVFGYAKGDQMVGIVAPGRRAAFAIRETLAANLTSDGIKLFDALLNWVLM